MDKKYKIKILYSCISTVVAMILLGYSTYGWMAVSREVTATGMNVTVEVPDGLEISLEENGIYSQSVDVKLKDVVAALTAGTAHEFNVTRDGFFLLPASSYEGLSVWATEESDALGNAVCEENEFHGGHTVAFNPSPELFEGHYIDVKLWFRTPSINNTEVRLNKLTSSITSANSASVIGIVRAAFLNSEANAVAYDGNVNYTDALVYTHDNANTALVVTKDPLANQSKYVAPKYLSYDANNVSNQVLFQMDPAPTGQLYSKTSITVRIWIEGQDSACVSSVGNKSFNVQLGFVSNVAA